MCEEPYLLWKKHMGQLVVANWSQLIDSYALLFGTPEPVDLVYIERMLKAQQQNSQITAYAFITKMVIQMRADKWARLLKEARNVKDEKDEIVDKKLLKASRVDKARRVVSFFYQCYMVMWRV
ncbi:hypothetical protein BDB00DRAFT_787896 [Zychaea mexicana]|uniref:uncharacterized protein n=1 Tax=Zychaea mexicana TaxID=64656 RepID=UPI0022FF1478|nr:uncharacterized protein BDB00DRAFT_787896 [Zychaea mexicana]KAI9493610.1 hypothetical protein BDB00DRAFT_787896 [Zychaea mexicana]